MSHNLFNHSPSFAGTSNKAVNLECKPFCLYISIRKKIIELLGQRYVYLWFWKIFPNSSSQFYLFTFHQQYERVSLSHIGNYQDFESENLKGEK